MRTNKALNIVASALALITIPIQLVTTFLTGLLTVVTFGLFMVLLDIIWNIVFLWPLLGTSWLWLRLPWMRPLVVIVGFPHALLAAEYCTLVGSMGDFEARRLKMRLAYTWPYSFDFFRMTFGKPISETQREGVNRCLVNAGI